MPMEVLFGDGLEGDVLVHARVVYEDVESAVVLDGSFNDALCLGGLGDVARHGDGLSTGRCDGGEFLPGLSYLLITSSVSSRSARSPRRRSVTISGSSADH
jgi:hypothetical protein